MTAGNGAGPGSTSTVTDPLRRWISRLVKEHDIKIINDAGCGKQVWIPPKTWGVDYMGYDTATYDKFSLVLDITRETMRRADLIICKDVFRHLDRAQIESALDLFDSTFLLCDTEPGAPPHDLANTPIDMLEFMDDPIDRIESKEAQGRKYGWFTGKWFGLWRM